MRLLMFPGQGSQYPGMGRDWCETFVQARRAFEEASDASGLDLKQICFEGSEVDLKRTEFTQPAILTVSIAIYRALQEQGLLQGQKKFIYAGHSLGEYSALVAAGILPLGEAARLVRHRGAYMQAAVPEGVGAMAALMFRPDVVDGSETAARLCEQVSKDTGKSVSVANYNAPQQMVISGHKVAVDAVGACALAEKEAGVRKVVALPVSAPFHCALMKAAADKLESELFAAKWALPPVSYIANVDAAAHEVTREPATAIARRLVAQITGSVQWVRSCRTALQLGCTHATEIGPGNVLAGLVKRIAHEGKTLEATSIDRWETFKNAGCKL